MSTRDTIFALATPFAKSSVAILRLSGRSALSALIQLSHVKQWTPGMLQLVTLQAPKTNEVIDKALAVYFKSPQSYTGEDVVELHIHGSLAVIRELLATLASLDDLRPAEPGEFTRRAYANGKMDLIEAEAVADLIDAETNRQKSQALKQLQGEASRQFEAMRENLVKALAHLEAYIDFPDEEIPESVFSGLGAETDAVKNIVTEALSDGERGERLREGIHVVILGAPNAGKSSLLNALAKKEAAIVSSRAGTTRDVIEVHMDIGGFPVILTDTAGIRESSDEIEEEGVKRALARADAADIRLVLFDGSNLPNIDEKSRGLIDENSLIVITKSDLKPGLKTADLPFKNNILMVSVKTGEGIEPLFDFLKNQIFGFFAGNTAPLITRARHRELLREALAQLEGFSGRDPIELSAEKLRRAALAVGKITGKIEVDELLDVIFKEFCIGK